MISRSSSIEDLLREADRLGCVAQAKGSNGILVLPPKGSAERAITFPRPRASCDQGGPSIRRIVRWLERLAAERELRGGG